MARTQDAPMTWLELRFTCDATTATQLAELLAERGALAVSLGDAEDQPVYEPQAGTTPLWPSTRVSGLFPGAENTRQLLAELQRRLAPAALGNRSMRCSTSCIPAVVPAVVVQALAATRVNATANDVGTRVEVREPRNLPPLAVHLLVSNILANTLSDLAQTLSLLLESGGCLALSGILSEQSPAVAASFAPWCALQPVATRDDWVLLAGTRYADGA